MKILDWPSGLESILSGFKPVEDRDWIETPMEAGPPKRRPRASPRKIYECEAAVDDFQRRRLYEMENEPGIVYRIVHPEAAAPEIVKLIPYINGVWREGHGGTLILKFLIVA